FTILQIRHPFKTIKISHLPRIELQNMLTKKLVSPPQSYLVPLRPRSTGRSIRWKGRKFIRRSSVFRWDITENLVYRTHNSSNCRYCRPFNHSCTSSEFCQT